MEHLQRDPELTTEKSPLESYMLIAKGYEELFSQMPNDQKNGENIRHLSGYSTQDSQGNDLSIDPTCKMSSGGFQIDLKITNTTGEENEYTINFSQSSAGEATATVIGTNDIGVDIFPKEGTYKNTDTDATSFETVLKLAGELIVSKLAFRDLAQLEKEVGKN